MKTRQCWPRLSPLTPFARWCLGVTLVAELVTIASRLAIGQSGAEYLGAETHWLIRMHHMFWALPLLVVALLVWRNADWRQRLLGIAAGLVLSDFVHHFLVLPLWVGNTGWHWP